MTAVMMIMKNNNVRKDRLRLNFIENNNNWCRAETKILSAEIKLKSPPTFAILNVIKLSKERGKLWMIKILNSIFYSLHNCNDTATNWILWEYTVQAINYNHFVLWKCFRCCFLFCVQRIFCRFFYTFCASFC